MEKGKYECTYTGELELTPAQFSVEQALAQIELEQKMMDAEQKDMLTVLAHSLDPSKPDLEFKDVFDICHTYGRFERNARFEQNLRLLMYGECKCLLHYIGRSEGNCEKDHRAKRAYVCLNDYTVEIAMQKGEQGNG